jgi:hypothetical protein
MAARHCDTSWHQWPEQEDGVEDSDVEQNAAISGNAGKLKRARSVEVPAAHEVLTVQEGKAEKTILQAFGSLAQGLHSFDAICGFFQDMRSTFDAQALKEWCDTQKGPTLQRRANTSCRTQRRRNPHNISACRLNDVAEISANRRLCTMTWETASDIFVLAFRITISCDSCVGAVLRRAEDIFEQTKGNPLFLNSSRDSESSESESSQLSECKQNCVKPASLTSQSDGNYNQESLDTGTSVQHWRTDDRHDLRCGASLPHVDWPS